MRSDKYLSKKKKCTVFIVWFGTQESGDHVTIDTAVRGSEIISDIARRQNTRTLRSSIFWGTTQFSAVKVNGHIGGSCSVSL
jgi:hypothetical protein